MVKTQLVDIFDHMENASYVCRAMDERYKSCGTFIFTGDLNIRDEQENSFILSEKYMFDTYISTYLVTGMQ